MAFLTRALLVLWLAGAAALAGAADPARFIALSYHEVLGEGEPATPTSVTARDLAQQFAWLAANGWQPVSMDRILAARAGGPPLPEKAVLLTFDDGKKDVYTRVFPLLKLFGYPAVIALVGEWLEVADGGTVDYDGQALPRSAFVTWAEVRDMMASGLIEVASHTFTIHRGIPANPQGNTEPAAITRRYCSGIYEDDAAYEARLRAGLRELVPERTGFTPRIIMWPWGRSNKFTRNLAAELGRPIGFSLEDGWNDSTTPLAGLRRQLVENGPSLQEFVELLRASWPADPARSVRIDPGTWGNPEAGLSATLDRLQALAPNIAFIRPAVIRDGLEMTLFPTSRRPLAADILNHVAWQTERRAGVPAFIDLPSPWLDDPELVGDLARQVNFAGLRLPAAPDDRRIAALREAAGRWRLPVQLAFAVDRLPGPDTWARLADGDVVIIPAALATPGALPASARDKVLVEFDAAAPAGETARRMRELEADGFRSFGLSGFPDPLPAEVARVLSLRSQPQLR
ncbi:MAG: poly-beta-1,6-N-acetyl-D-glucosamine N-deacetylase PgaB [Betaproteobacteria bacterium]|nr:poly-beta-1,6-N-acetyl-D-glucosamine N-deacetylase PgaB [Betaproteobacteria bacterium]